MEHGVPAPTFLGFNTWAAFQGTAVAGDFTMLENEVKKKIAFAKKISSISTRNGARTSLLIPSLQLFILAERANDGKGAAVAVFK